MQVGLMSDSYYDIFNMHEFNLLGKVTKISVLKIVVSTNLKTLKIFVLLFELFYTL